MKFVNRAKTGIWIDTFHDSGLIGNAPWKKSPGHLDHGQTVEIHQEVHDVRLCVYVDRPGKRADPKGLAEKLWAGNNIRFPNTTSVIITADEKNRVIDWKICLQKFIDDAHATSGSNTGKNDQLAAFLKTGAAIVNALATSLSALGPAGAAPAGLVMGVGSILLNTLGASVDEAPPSPPDIAEIESVVGRVVRDALNENDANKAATSFLLATEQFLVLATDTYERLLARKDTANAIELPPHRRGDLIRFVEANTWNDSEHSLNFWLYHLCDQPEIAKYVLPAFLSGIATSLHVRRLHELIAHIEDLPDGKEKIEITPATIKRYLAHVTMCRIGLEKAADAFRGYCKQRVAKESLADTPEGNQIVQVIAQSRVGADSLAAIDESVIGMKQIENALNEDLKTLTTVPTAAITHFWNSTWKIVREAPPPPAYDG